MNFRYKDNRSPSFFASKRLYKSCDNSCDLSEVVILQVQTAFLKIMDIDPTNLADDSRAVFTELEDIANFEKIKNHLHKIVPHIIYPQLVNFLEKTEDTYIHRIVSHLIVVLSSDVTKSLIELAKYDIMSVIDAIMQIWKFPYSTDYLFQIIANFLDDPNQNLSQYAHESFSIEYLFKLLQYIKTKSDESLKIKDPDIKINSETLSELIRSKWMMCIYTTISKYPEDVSVNYATIALIEVNKYFDIIQKDPILCKYLCYTISVLAEFDKIGYSDFNGFKFPDFLYQLSCYDLDESVKSNAFFVIGQLISINRFEIQVDFSHFFNIVLNSDESTDQNLLISSLYASGCFLKNQLVSEPTFIEITNNIQFLFDFYDQTVFKIKSELNRLFSNYIIYFSRYDTNSLLQYEMIIFTITNYFFDFIQIADDVSSIHPMIEAFMELNEYLYNSGQNSLPSADQYINNFNECIENLKSSENTELSEYINGLLKACSDQAETTI